MLYKSNCHSRAIYIHYINGNTQNAYLYDAVRNLKLFWYLKENNLKLPQDNK